MVERLLPKQKVEGSSPFHRSIDFTGQGLGGISLWGQVMKENREKILGSVYLARKSLSERISFPVDPDSRFCWMMSNELKTFLAATDVIILNLRYDSHAVNIHNGTTLIDTGYLQYVPIGERAGKPDSLIIDLSAIKNLQKELENYGIKRFVAHAYAKELLKRVSV